MNTGDTILYAISALIVATVVLLVLNQVPRKRFKDDTSLRRALDAFSDIDAPLMWLLRAIGALLIIDLSILTYYFYTTELTMNYVWTFSSKYLPLVYKLSGVLAGQQGTIFFWCVLVGVSSLWLSETKKNTDFMKRTQIVVLVLCLFFAAMTLKDSPFKTIYEVYGDEIPSDFVPDEGSGLNPLLIDPWMAVHPPIIFIAYGLMTVPFALAVVYLYSSIKGAPKKVYKEWADNVITWCRVSWIFLTLGIAIGGFWAYKVLGWGGFWAWDPVETSSLVPWFLLTGALHALVEHRKDPSKYNILAPLLVAWSFALIMYATVVTRSGFFESVHAFDAGETGFYLIIATAIIAALPLLLAIISYIKTKKDEEEGDVTFVNQANLFYITIILFIIFTFISFWGITFPAIKGFTSNTKIGIEASFYNIWSYPVVILLMLLAGLCLNYMPKTKNESIKEFLVFAVMTAVFGFIKPTDAWELMEYSPSIGIAGKPGFYMFIGSISILSFIPPSVYLAYSAVERFKTRHITPKRRKVTKGIGILIIHIGAALIVLGSVFSYGFDSEFPVTLNKLEEGKLTIIPGTPYGVELVNFKTVYEYKDARGEESESEATVGLSVFEFYDDIHTGIDEEYQVHGTVAEAIKTEHNTYLRLVEGSEELWVATSLADVPSGVNVIVTGIVQLNFPSSFLNKSFPVLLLASDLRISQGQTPQAARETVSTTQVVDVAIYEGKNEIARGAAKSVAYFNGNIERVMIDRGLKGDVYVILNGISGNTISLDLRIKPLINLLWVGIIFFTFGMIAVLVSEFTPKKQKARKKKDV
ncbi:cytochrome c biogenesis protein CcsA [archaeon]|nr:cytochrome c biogenesis protein CcsA [archaeon]